MNESTDWTQLARYLSGECSPEEEADVRSWMATSPDHERLLRLAEDIWSRPESQVPSPDIDALWERVRSGGRIGTGPERETPSRRRRPSIPAFFPAPVFRLAVPFLILIALGYAWVTWGPFNASPERITFTVENGRRETLALDDGTRVVLDAGSTLSYPGTFAVDSRNVQLSGEGYFEVAADPARPFVVRGGHAAVRVLGTRFNVRSWPTEGMVTVVVAEGSVSLQRDDDRTHQGVVLSGGEVSRLSARGRPTPPERVDVEACLGWMRNDVRFRNARLGDVLFQLERWYDTEFVLSDSSIAEERVNLHIQNEPLDEVVTLLSVMTGLKVERRGDHVALGPDEDREP